MGAIQRDLSYFTVRLVEMLQLSFPELTINSKFISARSGMAADGYEQAFKAGNPPAVCERFAEEILFQDLQFSKFDVIFKVVCNEFYDLLADYFTSHECRPKF